MTLAGRAEGQSNATVTFVLSLSLDAQFQPLDGFCGLARAPFFFRGTSARTRSVLPLNGHPL
jgi:hypothetical protein